MQSGPTLPNCINYKLATLLLLIIIVMSESKSKIEKVSPLHMFSYWKIWLTGHSAEFLIFSSRKKIYLFQFFSCILYVTKNPYMKGFLFILSGKPRIKCQSFACFINFVRVFFYLIYFREYTCNIQKLRKQLKER